MAHPFGLGIGGGLAFYGTGANIAAGGSDAETLAGSETDALAIVYTDDHFKATTGFNGSVFCVDSGTPANDYDSSPTTEGSSFFTYTSPSPKMILHDDGVLKYNAHNLVTYSEQFDNAAWTKGNCAVTANAATDPNGTTTADKLYENSSSANHFIYGASATLVSGASYYFAVRLKAAERQYAAIQGDAIGGNLGATPFTVNLSTGSIINTGSGYSSTGVIDEGDGWFTVWAIATATGTSASLAVGLRETSGSGYETYTGDGSSGIYIWGAHLHRYPADTTYLRTTSAARHADPIEFNSAGTALGGLVEPQRTNLLTYSSDITNAAWTKSNMTTAKTATGPGSVANQATTCTATAGNATALQAITSSSAQRVTSVWLKRRTGTGNIDLTQDNGSTWTTVAVDSDWTSFAIAAVTSANPTVGLRIVTSGDAVDVAFFQHELGSSATSPIETFASSVTRAADNISKATSGFATDTANMTLYAKFTPRGYNSATGYHVLNLNDGTSNDRAVLYVNNPTPDANFFIQSAGSSSNNDSTVNAAIGTQMLFAGAYALNSATAVADGTAGTEDTSVVVPTGSFTTLSIGQSEANAAVLHGHIQEILILPRRVSDADMQTLTATGALP